jgi:hypothetical protein
MVSGKDFGESEGYWGGLPIGRSSPPSHSHLATVLADNLPIPLSPSPHKGRVTMMETGLIKNKEQFISRASGFFETLFGQNPAGSCGEIEIRVFAGSNKQHFCAKPQEAAQVAYELCHCGIDTYFGVNPRMGKGGAKKNIHYVVPFHAEIDYGQDGHKKKQIYETYDHALEAIKGFDPAPTYGEIRAITDEREISVTQFIRELIDKDLDSRKRKEKRQ